MYHKRFSTMPPLFPAPPPPPSPSPVGFVLCPLVWFPVPSQAFGLWQQEVYRRAFEEARAVVRPALPERDLLGVWN